MARTKQTARRETSRGDITLTRQVPAHPHLADIPEHTLPCGTEVSFFLAHQETVSPTVSSTDLVLSRQCGAVITPCKKRSAPDSCSEGDDLQPRGRQRLTGTTTLAVTSDDSNGLCTTFAEMRERGLLIDVTVVVGDTRMPAHKIMLCARSRYFRARFGFASSEGTTAASAEAEVLLTDLDGGSVKALIDAFYTSELVVSGDMITSLIQAADYLGVDEDLMAALIEFLTSNIKPSNAVSMLVFADSLALTEQARQMRDSCLHYLLEHFNACSEECSFTAATIHLELVARIVSSDDLCAHSEDSVLQTVLLYARSFTQEQQETVLLRLLPLIRWPHMTWPIQLQNEADLLLGQSKQLDQLVLKLLSEQHPSFKQSSADSMRSEPRSSSSNLKMQFARLGDKLEVLDRCSSTSWDRDELMGHNLSEISQMDHTSLWLAANTYSEGPKGRVKGSTAVCDATMMHSGRSFVRFTINTEGRNRPKGILLGLAPAGMPLSDFPNRCSSGWWGIDVDDGSVK
jgi:hypothetical protein